VPRRRHSDETVVERQTVSDGVLPATADVRATVVRERRHYRRVYLAQRAPARHRIYMQTIHARIGMRAFTRVYIQFPDREAAEPNGR